MRKITSIIFLISLMLLIGITASADDVIKVAVDGKYIDFDVNPQIINGRTMVPIRAIFEEMGATVIWKDSTKSAICSKEEIIIKMTVGSKDMYINEQEIKMDVAPVEIGGRILVPARYVADALGADVQWSQVNNTVVICSERIYAYADFPDIPDLGRCYDIPIYSEKNKNGFRIISYSYSDKTYDKYYTALYDNSAFVLGEYIKEITENPDGSMLISYTKPFETAPRYFVNAGYDDRGNLNFEVRIPIIKDGADDNGSSVFPVNGYYYRTPKGKKYHLNQSCAGRTAYKTTDISKLSPCLKCVK